MFTRFALFLSGSLAFLVLPDSARAESGSCYGAEEPRDSYVSAMLDDLMRQGRALKLPDGRIYAAFENLPGASICNLVGVDLTGLDLSGLFIDKDQLEGARLCGTILPSGIPSSSGCD
ncbi:hypothetical protein [Roseibium sp.]|uniref:hypothetical protein n=1 Tax=Roseibium sp. TaxID=1936156 RepID=UPI003A969982